MIVVMQLWPETTAFQGVLGGGHAPPDIFELRLILGHSTPIPSVVHLSCSTVALQLWPYIKYYHMYHQARNIKRRYTIPLWYNSTTVTRRWYRHSFLTKSVLSDTNCYHFCKLVEDINFNVEYMAYWINLHQHRQYSGTLLNGHPSTATTCDITDNFECPERSPQTSIHWHGQGLTPEQGTPRLKGQNLLVPVVSGLEGFHSSI